MSYEAIAMLFLVLGIGLLILEFFVPSGGLIGLLCLVALVISVWGAKQAWYGSKPAYWFTYLAMLIFLIPGSVVGMIKFLQNSEYGESILLRGPSTESVTPYIEEERKLEAMVGKVGTAESELCPSGVCRIDGQRIDCLSDGMLIERGLRIKCVGHRGQYPIVRELTADELIDENLAKTDSDVADRNDEESDEMADPFGSENA